MFKKFLLFFILFVLLFSFGCPEEPTGEAINGFPKKPIKPSCVASTEVCDGIDNDCDKETDEGSLCPLGQNCVAGVCQQQIPVANESEEEFEGTGEYVVYYDLDNDTYFTEYLYDDLLLFDIDTQGDLVYDDTVNVTMVNIDGGPSGSPIIPQIVGYFVELNDETLAKKYVSLKETTSLSNTQIKNQINSYKSELEQKHSSARSQFSSVLSSEDFAVKKEFYSLFNGFAISASRENAIKLLELSSVKSVKPEYLYEINLMDSVPLIGASTAHSSGYTGEGISIAIIDTGVDYTHADLGSCFGSGCKVVDGYDFVNNDSDPMDDHGHGTHVAATAAGNGVLIGVAPDAEIYAYKVCDVEGYCPNILEGLERALDPNQDGDYSDHLDIVNMSLGTKQGGSPFDVLSLAVDDLVNAGVVATIAAGNNGSLYFKVSSPGSSRKAITVGASYKDDRDWVWHYFSSKGPTCLGTFKPDITAPGVLICAAQSSQDTIWQYHMDKRDIDVHCLDTEHISISGTSMATPHVAGAVALIKEAHPDWTPDEIKYALRYTAFDTSKSFLREGAGRINVFDAIQLSNKPPIAFIDYSSAEEGGYLDIIGTAEGENFSNYTLEYSLLTSEQFRYGCGMYSSWPPAEMEESELALRNLSWTQFHSSDDAVHQGTLFNNFSLLPFVEESKMFFKLTVENTLGQESIEYFVQKVNNLEVLNIVAEPFVRSQDPLVTVNGTVRGIAFQSYDVQWASGYSENDSELSYTSNGVSIPNPSTQVEEGLVATINTSVLPSGISTIKVTANTGSGQTESKRMVISENPPQKTGWPLNYRYRDRTISSPVVEDLDNDNQKEVVIMSGIDSYVTAFFSSGAVKWSQSLYYDYWPGGHAAGNSPNSAVATLVRKSSDGAKLFNSNGSVASGWPVEESFNNAYQTAPVVADLDNDNQDEIILINGDKLYAFNIDGSLAGNWPVNLPIGVLFNTPAVGDLDGDLRDEIVVTNGGSFITAYNDNGTIYWSNSYVNNYISTGSPAIADLDLDGDLEVIVIIYNKLYVLNHDGTTFAGNWPHHYEDYDVSILSSPAIGNLDSDPELEIVYGGTNNQPVIVLNHDGTIVSGWPNRLPRYEGRTRWISLMPVPIASPIIGDIDGDGVAEVVLGSYFSDDIFAWEANGTFIENNVFPLMGSTDTLYETGYINSIAMTDIENDGDLDIVTALEGTASVWDLSVAFNEETMHWPSFHFDAQRTGKYCLTVDGDGDGYFVSCEGAGDCDDSNPDIHPGRPEVCNGIDDNCNGLTDGEELNEVCGNGIDDDCDNQTDLSDDDCDCSNLSGYACEKTGCSTGSPNFNYWCPAANYCCRDCRDYYDKGCWCWKNTCDEGTAIIDQPDQPSS